MIVKQAAGELGLDRLVLDLHGRWPGRDLPTGAFAAGVAAFHLGRYAQAAKYWQRIAAPDWTAAMDGYAVAADWAEAGVIPPFRLEYHLDNKETALSAADSGDGVITHGGVRVRLLAAVPSTDAIARAMREEVEEKPISLNVSLASTLKQIPVQWLKLPPRFMDSPPPSAGRSERKRWQLR